MTDLAQRIASLSPAKRKLLDRLSSNEKNTGAPVAVVGMSCHFPGAPSIDEYWNVIAEGRNLSNVVPKERWDVDVLYDPSPDAPGRTAAKWACLLDDVDRFDPVFFGITPREASRMDPQQRLLLHCCWEAMEHAAIDPKRLSRSPAGVFIGVGQTDYSRVIAQYDNSLYHVDAHCGTGGALSICANRLSYIFNFTGPSVAVDTACSSGLVAVHQAVTSLRRGECDSAIAGGVNVCLTGDSFITLSKARMLSPSGACRPFDSRANGYVRGEGCGVVLLKRLSDAVRDGDRVLAIVRGTAVNHSGRTSGITAPSGLAQQRVIRAALADGGVRPDQIEYVEAHGTGTPLGDPIEVEALSQVFTANGAKSVRPVYVTSVKANIGHTEIAAGMAGMIKTILMMREGTIASQIEIEELNPHLRLEGSRIKIPQESMRWESESPRFAGVSSFGFGGTNSHVVLQSAAESSELQNGSAGKLDAGTRVADRAKTNGKPTADRRPPMLLPLSARTKSSLQNLAESYRDVVTEIPDSRLADVCYTAGIGRGHFDLRAAIIGDTREDLISGLDRLAHDRRASHLRRGRRHGSAKPSIAAMFTGQGSQYVNMGMELYQCQPEFRSAMDECDEIIRELRGQSVLSVIRGETDNESVNETRWTQPALFALEYSLARLWKSWGVEADYLIGHSVGEYVAATVADVFDLDTGLQLICKRGDLMQSLPAGGSMAVVFAPGSDVEGWLSKHLDVLTIAAYNGPGNTTIAGKETVIKRAVEEFEKEGVSAQLLEVSHAFHSPLMDTILGEFEQFASQFEFRAPQIPIVSNLTGNIETGAAFTAKYWRDHIRNPVRFAQGVARLTEEKVDCLVEMGPSTALVGMARRCDPDLATIAVGSLKRGGDERTFAIQSLADLYTVGVDPDWSGLVRDHRARRIDLPGYPFDTDKYWFEPEHATTRFRDFIMSTSHVTPTLGSRLLHPTMVVFESRLTSSSPKHLGDHRVLGDVVVPGSAYVEMALSAAAVVFDQENVTVENLNFSKAMFLSECPRVVQTHVIGESTDRKRIQIFSRPVDADDNAPWDLNASCSIVSAERPHPAEVNPTDVKSRRELEMVREEFYELVASRGLDYGDAFRVLEKMWRCPSEVYCEAHLDDSVQANRHRYSIHPAIGDGCMQAMTGAVPLEADGSFCPDLYLPISVKRVTIFESTPAEESDADNDDTEVVEESVAVEGATDEKSVDDPSTVQYYVKRTSEITGPSPDWVEADVSMFDHQGRIISFWEGVRVQRVSEKTKEDTDSPDRWLYEIQWKTLEQDVPTEGDAAETVSDQIDTEPSGDFLIVSDGHGFTNALAQRLVADQSTSKPGRVEIAAIGDLVPPQNTPLPDDLKCHSLGSSNEAMENFHSLMKEWVADLPPDGAANVVLCRGLDADAPVEGGDGQIEPAQQIWSETFRLLTNILVTTFPGRVAVWLVTQGARRVADDDLVNPNQSPLVGLGQVASLELRRKSVRQVDLDPTQSQAENVDSLIGLLHQRGPEPAVAVRKKQILAPRLERTDSLAAGDQFSSTVPTDSAYRLRLGNNDTIDSLRFERNPRRRPERDEVEVEVRAAGLNFSDVLKAIGLYPGITDDVVPLGLECSGVVSSVGPDVENFKVGDEVVGIVPHGFASHCITPEVGLVAKPNALDHEEAAVIPVAFLTAYYCLNTVARLQPGERVLIHAGAGGVGLAAIQIAQEIGAEVFATAGSDEKREFLQAIGVHHVMNSRTLAFAEEIDQITSGQGVDVVLNSLPGDAIDKSIESLAPYGRFVEIGKTDIYANKPLSLSPFQDNLSYSAVDLDRLFRQRPKVARELMTEVMERFERGVYEPSHSTLFPIQEVVGAFRFMSQRKNIGKVVVSIESLDDEIAMSEIAQGSDSGEESSTIRSDGSYWITGGLGALGLETAKWLAERGAGGVVLMSRRGPDEDQRSKIDRLEESGTKVYVVSGDVCDFESLTAAMASVPAELPPIRGVLHAAGVLRDKLMAEMSDDDFRFPLGPKTRGTWNLHLATSHLDLDFFVLFSSVSSVLGTGGQSNYGAANSYLDGFAEYRTAIGKPTVAINWGAFSGSGMAEELAEMMESQGVHLLPVQESFELIEPIIQSAQPRATVFRADWKQFGGLLRSLVLGELQFGLIEDLAGDADDASGVDGHVAEAIREELRLLDPDQMQVRLQTFFGDQLSEIMGIEPEDIDPQATLTSLGMDSLMAIELGNKMQLALQIELPMSVYLEGPTIENLAGYVRGVLCKELGLETGVEAADDESAVQPAQS